MIQPIVEGDGEVEAVPLLLRRLATAMGIPHVPVGRPIRKDRGQIVKREGMEKAIELARRQPGCRAVFILFDADDLCTKTDASPLQKRVTELARNLPNSLTVANKEYEGWFLAGLESLGGTNRNLAPYPHDSDQKRGAKEELERRLGIYYNERADQPKFSARVDLQQVYRRSRSFQKLVKEYRRLLEQLGFKPGAWPKED